MKTRYKIYKNKVQGSVSERYLVKRKLFGKKWETFKKKGHEKMTIMFIPHNEKKIFNFQISHFTVSFFALLFVIVIATSAYAVIKNAKVKQEEAALLSNYRDIRSQLLTFERTTNEVNNLIEDMKPDIDELYLLTAGNEDVGSFWDENDSTKRELTPEEKKVRSMLPEEIFILRELQQDMLNATNMVKTVKNFVDVRNKVINDTPSILPLGGGHITSLFGWRRSPFGFGREFHPGIDISTPQGKEIRAAAPGEVVSAGWYGGYGNAIVVRHKYGFETVYGHCSRLAVTSGQKIASGQVIAYVGMTGLATGPHCHYEIRLGGVAINPYPYMSPKW